MSNSESYIVFSADVPEELRMIDNLSRKARTMKDYKAGGFTGDSSLIGEIAVADPSGAADIVYPGEYRAYNESP